MNLDDDLDRLLSGGPFLVGVDFDGPLAPIVDHPDLAEPDQEALRHLRDLAASDRTHVAIVSGRALADLRERVGDIPGATYVGEHGNDVGGQTPSDPVIEKASAFIGPIAIEAGGATVEVKSRSVTFHYRHLSQSEADDYLERIRSWAADNEVEVIEGKRVIELTTGTRNKGDAVLDLAGDRPFIYIGDDTTDETVFEVLRPGDVGVKVGDGPTAAPHRVKDVAEVVEILERLNLPFR